MTIVLAIAGMAITGAVGFELGCWWIWSAFRPGQRNEAKKPRRGG
jgi:hypothetical protein